MITADQIKAACYTGLVAVTLFLPTISRATDQDHKKQVAQTAFLALLAPIKCTDYSTNVEAVAEYMAEAGIDQGELFGAYEPAIRKTTEAFIASVEHNRDAACNQFWRHLGEGGLGLLNAKD